MECPICGCDDIEILDSKQKPSKKKIVEEYILKCNDCHHVFKDVFSARKPKSYRIIISENDKSIKSTIDLSPDDTLEIGDTLLSDKGQVQVSGIETKERRVSKSKIEDIITIWASSIEIPARIGFSVDLHGKVDAYKLDLERDFEISTEDIVKIDKHTVKIHVIKTIERKITKGFARANVIKRVYAKPTRSNNYDYDLTKYIIKKT